MPRSTCLPGNLRSADTTIGSCANAILLTQHHEQRGERILAGANGENVCIDFFGRDDLVLENIYRQPRADTERSSSTTLIDCNNDRTTLLGSTLPPRYRQRVTSRQTRLWAANYLFPSEQLQRPSNTLRSIALTCRCTSTSFHLGPS